jgi:hypothetical protein
MIKITEKHSIKKISKTKKIKNNKNSTTAKLFQQISIKRIMLNKDIKTKLKIIRTQWTYQE